MHLCDDARDLLAECEIDVQTLPPHTTHKTQGLDKVVFAPLKRSYSEDTAYRLVKKMSVCVNNFPE